MKIRKDQRTKIQATQQSEMISQRKNDGSPVDFENQNDLNKVFLKYFNYNINNYLIILYYVRNKTNEPVKQEGDFKIKSKKKTPKKLVNTDEITKVNIKEPLIDLDQK